MIDVLQILHIRRFGLRYITFLESYTTFVASTVNIYLLQSDIESYAAMARLSLNIEFLRGSSCTPSSKKAIDTIRRNISNEVAPNSTNIHCSIDQSLTADSLDKGHDHHEEILDLDGLTIPTADHTLESRSSDEAADCAFDTAFALPDVLDSEFLWNSFSDSVLGV